ncbi:MAG: lipoprotein-releasing ABC transporter permease subunit [Hyphomicrobiales bacterium]
MSEFSPPRAFSAIERMLALRYLRARGKDSVISAIAIFSFIGVMLGVATLIIVMSVMNGFRKELYAKFLGLNGHVLIHPIESPLTDYKDVVARLLQTPGVVSAKGFIEGEGLASSPAGAAFALVRGMSGADLEKVPGVASNIRSGGLQDFDDAPDIVIGARLASQLGVGVGDKVTLIAPRGATTPMGVVPRLKAYTVVAIFEIGMSLLDSSNVFIPFQEADNFFDKNGEASVIEVFIDDPDRIDEMRPIIEKAAGRPVLLTDWRQSNRPFFSALAVERNVMFLILMLIVVVAALNIVSGMIMLVKDKGTAIAILRTMGATQGTILRVFLLTGGAIGVVGTIAGFGLGLLITLNVEAIRQFLSRLTSTPLFSPELYFLSQLPAELDWHEVATITVTAFVLSLLATLYPAWKAASLDPVEQLRRG